MNQAGISTMCGWHSDPVCGLLLYWTPSEGKDYNPFPSPLSPEGLIDLVWSFLQDKSTWEFADFIGTEANTPHDGSNSQGWRVYCEDHGHVKERWQVVMAIKPVYLHHGK
jgi:hypothetical protein